MSIIFYSWQSDLPNSTNRSFIENALQKAAKDIKNDEMIDVEPVIDRDTAGIPGSPDITESIFAKINKCGVFACDISIINSGKESRSTPNPNVLVELGYAIKALGWDNILLLHNLGTGNIEDLPFDIRTRRILTYTANEGEPDRSLEKKNLHSKLISALKLIYENNTIEAPEPITFPTEIDNKIKTKLREQAVEGLADAGLEAFVEAVATLSFPREKIQSQKILLDAIRNSKINTYGWPIGVMGDSDGMRPTPVSDGIFNSVKSTYRSTLYDFWKLSNDGCFYLLQSLSEDGSDFLKEIYFNTRIHRTTELLLFLSNIFRNLNIQQDAYLNLELTYFGLEGRHITATNSRAFVPYGPAKENEVTTSIRIKIADLDAFLIEKVKELLNPVFILFNYFEIEDRVYQEIVENFKNGRIT